MAAARALDHREELLPLLRAEGLSEEIAEEVDVVAEWLVGGVGHREECSGSGTSARRWSVIR